MLPLTKDFLKIYSFFIVYFQELNIIYYYLHGMDILSHLREHQLSFPKFPSTGFIVGKCELIFLLLETFNYEIVKLMYDFTDIAIIIEDYNPQWNTHTHTTFIHNGIDIFDDTELFLLRIMTSSARYKRYDGNQVLFCSDTIARCWYILLSGSVLMKDSMYEKVDLFLTGNK
ncbi:Rap guanine nucleotide exchange factor 6 [Varanus komodoensis]|nr:Rap guanine nucleotide exchange factor 6 [Varanus komodoensis]